jgi:hypothetical protein
MPMKREEEQMTRILWVWIHARGGQETAQIAFELPGRNNDTVSFSVNVPVEDILSVNRFCRVLLREQLNLTGSEDPRELYELGELLRLHRALEHVHQRVWTAMLRAANITSENAVLQHRITSLMCQNPAGDSGGDAA